MKDSKFLNKYLSKARVILRDKKKLKDLIERVLSDNYYIEEIARTGQDCFISYNVQNNIFPFIEKFKEIFQ